MQPTRVGSEVGCVTSAAGGWRYLAIQIGSCGATDWRRNRAASRCCPGGGVGGGEDICMAGPSAAAGQGLRAIAGDRRGHDLLGHEPHHASQARQRDRLKCLRKGLRISSFEVFCKTVSRHMGEYAGCSELGPPGASERNKSQVACHLALARTCPRDYTLISPTAQSGLHGTCSCPGVSGNTGLSSGMANS